MLVASRRLGSESTPPQQEERRARRPAGDGSDVTSKPELKGVGPPPADWRHRCHGEAATAICIVIAGYLLHPNRKSITTRTCVG